ncbi:MAG: heme ABC transporter ATP-binding protein [Armatimonadetes bacterium]|nr:heme ABC transporter ATP-binding protein [Armatimonadota bacterium]
MQSLFKLDRLRISYNSVPVLDDISFKVNRGEFLGIIGPNGSGKSTLLRAMTGILPPAAGSVKLEGKEVSQIPSRSLALRIAVVPQEILVTFDFTVLEIVLMGRAPYLGRLEFEDQDDLEIAREALKRTNLLHLANRRIEKLSGGERQRVMIARALAQNTDILFLDEPTAHLDINYQVEILHLLKRENVEYGKTIVVVLHDLNLAAEFCNRLLMLSGGKLYVDGTPEEVITASNVQKVYGTPVWVRRHPTSGRPYVLSISSRGIASKLAAEAVGLQGYKVHVICGGGSGATIFANLLEMGCEVTAGVVNIGDTDQEAAETLGIEYVEESPFSPISEKAQSANVDFILRSDAVVVAEAPFGTGNLANLQCALQALEAGKPVAVIGQLEGFAERDFSNGRAAEMFGKLIENGASVLNSADELAAWIAKTRTCVV